MWWYHGNWGWGAWLLMTAGMVAFWGLVIWAVVTLTRNAGTPASPDRARSPEEILAERLATGEIDEDEYRRRLEVLQSSDVTPGRR